MSTADTVPDMTADQVVEVACDIWSSFLALGLVPVVDAGGPLGEQTVRGSVRITGDWEGSVLLEATRSHARAAAEVMFDAVPGSLSEAEVDDALGELTNMVGGNVKGLLAVPTTLSLPAVGGADADPSGRLVERVRLECPAGPLRVSVWAAA